MIHQEEVFHIGRITKTRGIRGEVELLVTDSILEEGFTDCLILELDSILVPFFFETYRRKSSNVAILKLAGYDTEQATQHLVGAQAFCLKACISTDYVPSFTSLRALQGFQVLAADETILGRVEHVDESSANVLLYLRRPDAQEVIIPYHEDFLLSYDLRLRTLHLSLPEGVLQINNS